MTYEKAAWTKVRFVRAVNEKHKDLEVNIGDEGVIIRIDCRRRGNSTKEDDPLDRFVVVVGEKIVSAHGYDLEVIDKFTDHKSELEATIITLRNYIDELEDKLTPKPEVIEPYDSSIYMVLNDWKELYSFIDFLRLDGSIEPALAQRMTEKLLVFKRYAYACERYCQIEDGWIPPNE